MALLWTSPRTFQANKVLTATHMNEINNNISFLYNRPQKLVDVRGSGVNLTATSTTFVDVDAGGTFSFTLETSGGGMEFNLLGTISNNTINTLTAFDIYMDGTTWLSSLTGTALTNGIWQQKTTVAASVDSIKATPYRLAAGAIPAGSHTYVLKWRVSAGTSTIYLAAGNLVQFSVVETA